MAFHDDKHVISMEGVVIWDGLTKPDPIESDPGNFSHNLRIAFKAGCPEQAELEQLVQAALAASQEFKGVMPHGGNHPISAIDPSKFPELPGYLAFSAGTRLGAPAVFDMNGAELQPMQYGRMIYNGTIVRILVHAYAYSNKQKGVNFGLDGVQIVDATAPRLSIGAAGLDKNQVAAAFGAKPAAATTPVPAVPGATTPPPAVPYTGYADVPTAPVWPPVGWTQHPSNPQYWFMGQEVITETKLRARVGA